MRNGKGLTLLSGRVKKTASTSADSNRYTWLDLKNAEPDAGVPSANNSLFTSTTTGTRSWLTTNSSTSGLKVVSGALEVDEDTTYIDTAGFINTSANDLHTVLYDLDQNLGTTTANALTTVATDGTIDGAGITGNPLSIGQGVRTTDSPDFSSLSVNMTTANAGYTFPSNDGSAGTYLKTDGSNTISFDRPIQYGGTAPTSPDVGDLWYDSVPNYGATEDLLIWTGSAWASATTGGAQAAFILRTFTGDGSTTAFDTSSPTTNSVLVYVNGSLLQGGGADYTYSSGVVTFTSAPLNNAAIQVLLTGDASLVGLELLGIAYHDLITVDSLGNVTLAGDLDMDGNKIVNLGTPTANTDAATKGYVDSAITANTVILDIGDGTATDAVTLGTDTLVFSGTTNEIETAVTNNTVTIGLPNDVTIGQDLTVTQNLTVGGYLAGPATFTIDPATVGDNTGTVVIAGNLTVQGTTTTIDSNTVNIGDNIIVLNADETGTPSQDAGIEIERGTSDNAALLWVESAGEWQLSVDNTTFYKIVSDADNYVADVAAGTGITVTHTPGAASTATIALQDTGFFLGGDLGLTTEYVDLGETLDIHGTVDIETTIATNNHVNIANTSTLDTVTGRGNTTANTIEVGGLAVDTSAIYYDTANTRVGIHTTSPQTPFHFYGQEFRLDNLTGQVDLELYGANDYRISSSSLNSFDIYDITNTKMLVSINNAGSITFNQAYTFPILDGSASQVLSTDGTGSLNWSDIDAIIDWDVIGNYAFRNFSDGTNTAEADSNADTFTFNNGTDITATVTSATDSVTFNNTSTLDSVTGRGNTTSNNIFVGTVNTDLIQGRSTNVVANKLDFYVDTTNYGINTLQLESVSGMHLLFDTNDNDSNGFTIGSGSNSIDSAAIHLAITNTGNVGVGISDPGYKLAVIDSSTNGILVGNTAGTGVKLLLDGNSDGDGLGADFVVLEHDGVSGDFKLSNLDTASGNFRFYTQSSTQRFTILNGGNVGIGSTNPANRLSIVQPNDTTPAIKIANNSAETAEIGYNATNVFRVGTTTNDEVRLGIFALGTSDLKLYSNGAEQIKIASTGAITFNQAFTFPTADGNTGEALITDGTGSVSWGSLSSTIDWNVANNYAFKTITDGATNAVADSNADTFKIRSSDQIEVTVTSDDVTHGDNLLIGHADSGVTANTYGSATAIPVLTIDAQGHITGASTSSINTSWTLTDGSTSQTISGGDTLTVADGTDINVVVSATDTLTVNNTSTLQTVVARGNETTNEIVVTPVTYAANQDAAYLIAAATNYDGTTTNWGTEGFSHKIKTDTGGIPRLTIDSPTGNGEVFTVKHNGNIGIGTNNPETNLHVNGSWVTNYGTLSIDGPLNGLAGIGIRGNSAYQGSLIWRDGTAGDYLELTSYNSNPLYLKTNNTERIAITGTGDVGIGTTSMYGKLDVFLNTNRGLSVDISSDGISGVGLRGINPVDGNLRDISIEGEEVHLSTGASSGSTATPRLSILASGRVGIGYTNPQNNIHVLGNATTPSVGITLQSNDTANATATLTLMARDASNVNQTVNIQNYRGDLNIDSNVGIGTTTPAEALDVVGNAQVSGSISAGGNIITENAGSAAGIYTFQKTVATSGTSDIFTISNSHGAQVFTVMFNCSTSGMSVAKHYTVVHQFGQTPITNLTANTGPYSGQDFTVSFTDAASNTGVKCAITNGSATIAADITVTLVLGGSPQTATVTAH